MRLSWQLSDADCDLVNAFMRGLNRTVPLKFNHPDLDTAATRDDACLLVQNDIDTSDAHVLVIQVQEHTVTLTYSDLHRRRFAFPSPCSAFWARTGRCPNRASLPDSTKARLAPSAPLLLLVPMWPAWRRR